MEATVPKLWPFVTDYPADCFGIFARDLDGTEVSAPSLAMCSYDIASLAVTALGPRRTREASLAELKTRCA